MPKAVPPEEARRLYQDERRGPWTSAAHSFAYVPPMSFLSHEGVHHVSRALKIQAETVNRPPFALKRNAFIRRMLFSDSEAASVAYLVRRQPIGYRAPEAKNWVTLCAMLSHLFSRGSAPIASADSAAKPTIDFQYYNDPSDLDIHGYAILALEKIARTAPLSDFIKRSGLHLPFPTSSYADSPDSLLTLEQAKEICPNYSSTNYHPCGTCSMLPEVLGGVVSKESRVYGTSNVRCVDASIMPIIPRANIITTVYALAERAADLLLGRS